MSNSKKTVAITGGASGLGKAMALRYARAGWGVAIADLNDERGESTLQELNDLCGDACYHHVDVRDAGAIEGWRDAILQRWGHINVVINNAGIASHGGIAESSLEDWDFTIDINLMGVVRGCKFFSQTMKQQGYGHIVNIASMAGLIHSPEMNSYNATKAAVVALSETMQFELAPFGIGVTVVCPGFFQTNLAESTRSPDSHAQAHVSKMLATSDITADDIADQVFNAVDSNQFMLLPHKSYRNTWYWKRFMPSLYNNKMGQYGAKLAAMRRQPKA
ncbi:SDR family oxidoreductase [Ketobacter sp.]|uniref:SDR family oxidoreductase n=1 Tax=Ketobacter sp. TaxID=2083498 RepID=UPI000F116057|nr:SDR family oxidoreductase [Ketobacter sp.]MEE2731174.1 SDR family oxidoreductase [Pseudomonadota bacterium]RLT95354.1 MAG: SDR family oxidoreductase [Ketobacter sp.]